MSFYVYSTATNSTTYVEYEPERHNDLSLPKKWQSGELAGKDMKVTIQGGHGVANKYFVTPKGVVTKVSDDEMEMLLANKSFKRHMDKGFITYDKKNVEPLKKAQNMAQRDGCSPLVPADYVKSDNSEGNTTIYKCRNVIPGQG